ncbi:MAG: glycosyltransferase family 4 protein, partial [Thermodesulfobacteriota bacterium]|nr:glycosyltransferase family 4 protein [Thermodesulfobacteriota bacterium]
LIDSGHEVHVFAHEWKGKKGREKGEGIVFHRVPMLKGLSVLEVLSFAVNCRRMLKRKRFDIIQSFERTLYQDIYRAGDGCHREWLIQRRKIDPWYKAMTNAINPLHLGLLWIESEIFREGNYRAIIANSQRGKAEIMAHYGVPPEKIRVIYTPVDRTRFSMDHPPETGKRVRNSLGIPDEGRVLLFVGSGFKRKGLSGVIEALPMVGENTHLIVIGKDRIAPYRSLARKAGKGKYVHFIGPLSSVERYYCAADLFVFPTIYEPFSNVCLEAMASGLPMVTSRINGASEVVEDGKNGYVIENSIDHFEIADKIIKGLMLNRDEVKKVNSKILKDFTWETHIENVLNIYSEIAGK